MGCLAVIALAFLSEILESGIFGNHIEWRDILADTCGVFAAMLLVFFATRGSTGDQEIP
jgi:hypothetical protein